MDLDGEKRQGFGRIVDLWALLDMHRMEVEEGDVIPLSPDSGLPIPFRC